MEKFSKLKKKKKKRDSVLWEDETHKISQFDEWTFLEGNDCIACVPILLDSNQIVLRQEYIPAYTKRDSEELYLNVVGGGIEEGETPEEALRRELVEEAGIVLRDNYPVKFETNVYVSKGCNQQYYICILPLDSTDFYEVEAKGDGSKAESLSKPVKIYNYNVENLTAPDLLTELMLMKTRKYLNI